jgi:hypothetical protein
MARRPDVEEGSMTNAGDGAPPPYGQQPNQPQWGQPSSPQGGQQPPPGYPPAGQGGYPAYPPAPPYYGYGYPQPQARPSNGLAVASLVCGIVGVLIFGIILGPLAVIFGAVGLSRANNGASGKGMAVAGLVLGLIAAILAIILLALLAHHRLVI